MGGTMNVDPVAVRTISLGRVSDSRWPGRLSASGLALDLPGIRAGLDRYYVETNSQARTRCIDGRHDTRLDENSLGPQVPGGAPGAALAHLSLIHISEPTRRTPISYA